MRVGDDDGSQPAQGADPVDGLVVQQGHAVPKDVAGRRLQARGAVSVTAMHAEAAGPPWDCGARGVAGEPLWHRTLMRTARWPMANLGSVTMEVKAWSSGRGTQTLRWPARRRASVVEAWPVWGVYWRGSSQMTQVVTASLLGVGNCVPQAEQTSQEAGLRAS